MEVAEDFVGALSADEFDELRGNFTFEEGGGSGATEGTGPTRDFQIELGSTQSQECHQDAARDATLGALLVPEEMKWRFFM